MLESRISYRPFATPLGGVLVTITILTGHTQVTRSLQWSVYEPGAIAIYPPEVGLWLLVFLDWVVIISRLKIYVCLSINLSFAQYCGSPRYLILMSQGTIKNKIPRWSAFGS